MLIVEEVKEGIQRIGEFAQDTIDDKWQDLKLKISPPSHCTHSITSGTRLPCTGLLLVIRVVDCLL